MSARLAALRRARALLAAAVVVLSAATGLAALSDATHAEPRPACPTGMADAVTAVARARACGARVEVLGRRSEREQVFANTDGSYTLETSAVPRRVRRTDGSWTGIDTSLRRAGGQVRPVATAAELAFSAGGSGPLVTIAKAGRELSLTLPWPVPAPVLNGPRATYRDVLTGVDLVLTARPEGFSKALIVRTREAASDPAVRTLRFRLDAPGLTMRASGGGFVAVDRAGETAFTSPAPAMWDSSGGAAGVGAAREPDRPVEGDRVAGLTTNVGPDELVIVPDRALLDDPRTVLPLHIDPQVEAGRQDWAMISSGFPSQPYYNFSPDEGVGLCDVQTDWRCNRDQVKRVAWEFVIPPQVHGTIIKGATFRAFETHAWDCTADWVELWVVGAVSSGTTWNNHAWLGGVTAVNIARASGCTNGPGWVDFAAAGPVASAIAAGLPTLGLGLRAGNENSMAGGWKRFRNDATLTINYNTPPAVPDGRVTIGTSQRVGCDTAGRLNATGGAHLSATVRDSDAGAAVLARFQWQDVTAATPVTALPDTPSVAPPHAFEAELPASSMPDGHTIQWRVKGYDGADEGAWSPWCVFTVDNSTPGQPTITATDLPAFPAAPPSTTVVGVPATARLSPAVGENDIVGYYYGVGPVETFPTIWAPAGYDGTAVVPVVPVASGLSRNFLTVVAVDEAGNRSPVPPTAPSGPGTRQFRANAAAPAPSVRGDATGDGRADVTTLSTVGGVQAALWRWDSTAGGVTAPTAPQDVTTTYPTATTRVVHGDFDGDRLGDVAVFTPDGANVRLSVQRSAGNGLFGAPAQILPGWNLAAIKPVVGNFDGDAAARDDIGVFYHDAPLAFSIRVLLANGVAGDPTFAGPATWYTNPPGQADWNAIKPLAGDFDGDGRADIGWMYGGANCHTRIWMHYSTGSSLGAGVLVWDSPVNTWCWDRTAATVTADYDGDGRADLAAFYRDDGCQTRLYVLYGNANRTLAIPASPAWTSGAGAWCADRAEISAGDHNGDGRADIAAVYRCCHGYQVKLYTFTAAAGRTFNAPVRRYSGALGPVGTRSNANLLIGAPGAASSSAPTEWGWSLPAVTDGAAGGAGWSSWCCLEVDHTEWLELTLPEAGEVNRVVLYPRGDAPHTGQGFPVNFTIEVWDGAAWVIVVSRTGYPAPTTAAGQVFTFPTRTAHKIRVVGTSLRIMQFAEVEAFRQ